MSDWAKEPSHTHGLGWTSIDSCTSSPGLLDGFTNGAHQVSLSCPCTEKVLRIIQQLVKEKRRIL